MKQRFSLKRSIIRQKEIATCNKNIIVYTSVLPIYVIFLLDTFVERVLKKLEKSVF